MNYRFVSFLFGIIALSMCEMAFATSYDALTISSQSVGSITYANIGASPVVGVGLISNLTEPGQELVYASQIPNAFSYDGQSSSQLTYLLTPYVLVENAHSTYSGTPVTLTLKSIAASETTGWVTSSNPLLITITGYTTNTATSKTSWTVTFTGMNTKQTSPAYFYNITAIRLSRGLPYMYVIANNSTGTQLAALVPSSPSVLYSVSGSPYYGISATGSVTYNQHNGQPTTAMLSNLPTAELPFFQFTMPETYYKNGNPYSDAFVFSLVNSTNSATSPLFLINYTAPASLTQSNLQPIGNKITYDSSTYNSFNVSTGFTSEKGSVVTLISATSLAFNLNSTAPITTTTTSTTTSTTSISTTSTNSTTSTVSTTTIPAQTGCNVQVTVYVGGNLTCQQWTVALANLGTPNSNGQSAAAVNIYHNGILTNATSAYPGYTTIIRYGNQVLIININQTSAGLYAYQKWASIYLSSSNRSLIALDVQANQATTLISVGSKYDNSISNQIFQSNPALNASFGPGSEVVQAFGTNRVLVAGFTSQLTSQGATVFVQTLQMASTGRGKPLSFSSIPIINTAGQPVVQVVIGSLASQAEIQAASYISSSILNLSASNSTTTSTTSTTVSSTSTVSQSGCNVQVTVYVGGNVTCNQWSVQLAALGAANSQGVSPALLSVYYGGLLTNQTSLYPPGTVKFTTSGYSLYVNVNQTFPGLYAYQKWAKITLTPVTSTSTTTYATSLSTSTTTGVATAYMSVTNTTTYGNNFTTYMSLTNGDNVYPYHFNIIFQNASGTQLFNITEPSYNNYIYGLGWTYAGLRMLAGNTYTVKTVVSDGNNNYQATSSVVQIHVPQSSGLLPTIILNPKNISVAAGGNATIYSQTSLNDFGWGNQNGVGLNTMSTGYASTTWYWTTNLHVAPYVSPGIYKIRFNTGGFSSYYGKIVFTYANLTLNVTPQGHAIQSPSLLIYSSDAYDPYGRYWEMFNTFPGFYYSNGAYSNSSALQKVAVLWSGATFNFTPSTGSQVYYFEITQSGGSAYANYTGAVHSPNGNLSFTGVDAHDALRIVVSNGNVIGLSVVPVPLASTVSTSTTSSVSTTSTLPYRTNSTTSASTTSSTTSSTFTSTVTPISNYTKFTVYFQPGWNLFSVPLSYATSVSATTCSYSSLGSPLWQLVNGQYVKASFVVGGVGYWVKLNSACSATFYGPSLTSSQIPSLSAGWNLIGSLSYTTYFSNVTGSCIATKGPLGFNASSSSYYNSSVLVPGRGYFVNVQTNCQLGNGAQQGQAPPGLP